MGESLNGMTLEELCSLEQKMDESVKIIRERKVEAKLAPFCKSRVLISFPA